MEFEHLLHRSNLRVLTNYLLHGGELFQTPPEQSYTEQFEKTQQKIEDLLHSYFPDPDQRDEIESCLNAENAAFSEIYFEMGLLCGAHMMVQMMKRWEEIK